MSASNPSVGTPAPTIVASETSITEVMRRTQEQQLQANSTCSAVCCDKINIYLARIWFLLRHDTTWMGTATRMLALGIIIGIITQIAAAICVAHAVDDHHSVPKNPSNGTFNLEGGSEIETTQTTVNPSVVAGPLPAQAKPFNHLTAAIVTGSATAAYGIFERIVLRCCGFGFFKLEGRAAFVKRELFEDPASQRNEATRRLIYSGSNSTANDSAINYNAT